MSSFVGVEDLTETLEDIHVNISSIKCEVYEAVRAFYTNNSTQSIDEAITFTNSWLGTGSKTESMDREESSVRAQIQSLEENLKTVMNALQHHTDTPHGFLANATTENERIQSQLGNSKKLIQVLDMLLSINGLFERFDTTIYKDNIYNVGQLFMNIKDHLKDLSRVIEAEVDTSISFFVPTDKESDDDTSILNLLKSLFLRKQNQLFCYLRNIYARMCSINSYEENIKKNQVSILTGISEMGGESLEKPIQFLDFWQTLECIGLVDEYAHRLATELYTCILKPIISDANVAPVLECNSTQFTIRLQCMSANREGSIRAVSPERACDHVLKVLEFVYQEIFSQNIVYMGVFGAVLWKQKSSLVTKLKNIIEAAIPENDETGAKLREFKSTVGEKIVQFEEQLHVIGFLQQRSGDLTDFINNLNRISAEKKRRKLLVKGRNVMKEDYLNTVEVHDSTERTSLSALTGGIGKKGKSGSEGVLSGSGSTSFKLPDLVVSASCHKLVELAHQSLIEACSANVLCAGILVQTTRDMISMFRAVIPTLHEGDIKNDARTCMLFHNDCIYIAHHLLTMGHQYRNRLPTPLNRITTMVDMVPQFRQLGEDALNLFARRLCEDMVLSLETCPSFDYIDSDSEYRKIEDCFKGLLYKTKKAIEFWRSGLPKDVYLKILGKILTPVLGHIINAVLKLSAISVDAAQQLNYLFTMLLEVETFFANPSIAEKSVPILSKFRKLGCLLDDTLVVIKEKYTEDKLHEFTREELSDLIRSIFQHSQKRADMLQLLQVP